MASSTAKVTFRVIMAVLIVLIFFYVGRPLYWKISATVHDIRQNKQTVKQGLSQIVLEAQRTVGLGWYHDESDSGLRGSRVGSSSSRRLLKLRIYRSHVGNEEMGSAISKIGDDFGDVLGSAFMAPLKSIFGQSCEGICSGPWDVICFIEHICVSNLLRLMMILVLCYIILLFFYILFKLGLCQCIGKSLCRICWACCETYWFALQDITCFLWHKLLYTKRVNRRRRRHRFRDIEHGYDFSSSDEINNFRYYNRNNPNRSHMTSVSRKNRHRNLNTEEVSVHFTGRSRRVRLSKVKTLGRVKLKSKSLKRRRLK